MTPPTTALARIAVTASALPLAAGALTVTWQTGDGTWHTAFCDSAADVPQGAAAARDGRHVVIERKWKRQRVTETTMSIGDVA